MAKTHSEILTAWIFQALKSRGLKTVYPGSGWLAASVIGPHGLLSKDREPKDKTPL